MKRTMKSFLKILLSTLVLVWIIIHFGNDAFRAFESDIPSRSRGTTGNGSLENGKRLPTSGPNFSSYSRLGALLGRTAVHNKVRDVLVDHLQKVSLILSDIFSIPAASKSRRLILTTPRVLVLPPRNDNIENFVNSVRVPCR